MGWGLYIHVPFCPTRCIYCDFYSQSNLSLQSSYVEALRAELSFYRSSPHWSEPPATIYFGGGTPSSLPLSLLTQIVEQIGMLWRLDGCEEMTIEANPEDVTDVWIEGIMQLGFNRASMGVQSLDDRALAFLHRRHSARQAVDAVTRLRDHGIENVSIDLIFALPQHLTAYWQESLHRALELPVTHISAYGLTYEEGTPLHSQLASGQVQRCSDETYVEQYYAMVDACRQRGFRHYELSNWALPRCESRHNSSYWIGTPYLGIGPSAHSYRGRQRWSNVCSLPIYIRTIKEGGSVVAEEEHLTRQQQQEELIMLGLRTDRGIDLTDPLLRDSQILERATPLLTEGMLRRDDDQHLRLTRRGLVLADRIMSDLFL